MKVAQSIADVLEGHVVLEVEGIDRMYLNVYVPQLQYEYGVVRFFREHRKQPWASSALNLADFLATSPLRRSGLKLKRLPVRLRRVEL